jgi:hypothetical protein
MSIINTLFQRAKELTTLLTHSMGQWHPDTKTRRFLS